MRATVEAGLGWLEEKFSPKPDDAWLLAPADHPTLDAAVVRQLVAARTENPQASVLIPTHAGRRGHPALIAWKHVEGMRALPPGQGLNVYLRRQEAETLELPVAAESILCDLDTAEDYERLRREWR
jgi:CTP:molybdopterin cytidylyltransferase MocA